MMLADKERTALGKYLYNKDENLGRIKYVATYYSKDGYEINIKVTADKGQIGEPLYEVWFHELDYEDMLDGGCIRQYMGSKLCHFTIKDE